MADFTKFSPNLNLGLADESDGAINFLDWRVKIDGSQADSNFMIVDTAYAQIQAQIAALGTINPLVYVEGTQTNPNLYTATEPDITAYKTDMIIILSLDNPVTGTTALNINNLGSIYIKKYNFQNNLVDLEADDLRSERGYFVKYDVTGVWIMISPIRISDLYMTGVSGNLLSISDSNTIIDSGTSLALVNHYKGYYATDTELSTAHPTGEVGDYAIVGSTETFWLWNGTSNSWVNSHLPPDLTDYYTKEQIDALFLNYYTKTEIDNTFLKLSGGTMTGDIDVGNNFIINYGLQPVTFDSTSTYPLKIGDVPRGSYLNKIIFNFTTAFNAGVDFIIGDGVTTSRFSQEDDCYPQLVGTNDISVYQNIPDATSVYMNVVGTPTMGSGTVKIVIE